MLFAHCRLWMSTSMASSVHKRAQDACYSCFQIPIMTILARPNTLPVKPRQCLLPLDFDKGQSQLKMPMKMTFTNYREFRGFKAQWEPCAQWTICTPVLGAGTAVHTPSTSSSSKWLPEVAAASETSITGCIGAAVPKSLCPGALKT